MPCGDRPGRRDSEGRTSWLSPTPHQRTPEAKCPPILIPLILKGSGGDHEPSTEFWPRQSVLQG